MNTEEKRRKNIIDKSVLNAVPSASFTVFWDTSLPPDMSATGDAIDTEDIATGQIASPFTHVALSNEVINRVWPNLPSAKELLEGRVAACAVLSPDEYEEYNIKNYTAAVPNLTTGETILCANIWLQYNGTAWIKVPFYFLNNSTQVNLARQLSLVTTSALPCP